MRSASTTRSWSARSRRAWNGSAIVRALQSSLTGQHPLAEAVALAHVRLQVDRRQVRRGCDAVIGESRHHGVAIDPRRELDDVDEPRADVVGVVRERRLDVDAGEQLVVARGDLAPAARMRSSFSSCPMPSAAEMSSRR